MYRIFDLQDGRLFQTTYLEDEFGQGGLIISASLREPFMIQQTAFDSSPSLDTRIQEMYHFLSVLKLFDPQFNTKRDGLSQIVSTPPPEPWETE